MLRQEVLRHFHVSEDLVAKATRMLDDGRTWYKVASRTSDATYHVTYDGRALHCSCPAGSPPVDDRTGQLAWQPRQCWHVRVSVAAEYLYTHRAENYVQPALFAA